MDHDYKAALDEMNSNQFGTPYSDKTDEAIRSALEIASKLQEGELVLVEKKPKPTNADVLELQYMMRDPKYWRDQDPSFIAKVTEGFQKLYGGKS